MIIPEKMNVSSYSMKMRAMSYESYHLHMTIVQREHISRLLRLDNRRVVIVFVLFCVAFFMLCFVFVVLK